MSSVTTWTITSLSRSPSERNILLRVKPDEWFTRIEGQFVFLWANIGATETSRHYSMLNTYADYQDTWELEFLINRAVDGIFSKRITTEAKLGTTLDIVWPLWRFRDRYNSRQFLFISTGSGAAPCISLIRSLQKSGDYDQIAHISGQKSEDELPSTLLTELTVQSDTVFSSLHLSQQLDDTGQVAIHPGHIQDAFGTLIHQFNQAKTTVFICWSNDMIEEVSYHFRLRGYYNIVTEMI